MIQFWSIQIHRKKEINNWFPWFPILLSLKTFHLNILFAYLYFSLIAASCSLLSHLARFEAKTKVKMQNIPPTDIGYVSNYKKGYKTDNYKNARSFKATVPHWRRGRSLTKKMAVVQLCILALYVASTKSSSMYNMYSNMIILDDKGNYNVSYNYYEFADRLEFMVQVRTVLLE